MFMTAKVQGFITKRILSHSPYTQMRVLLNNAASGVYLVEIRDAAGKRLASEKSDRQLIKLNYNEKLPAYAAGAFFCMLKEYYPKISDRFGNNII